MTYYSTSAASSDYTWSQWIGPTSGCTTSSSSDYVWYSWTSSTADSSSTSAIWDSWVFSVSGNTYTVVDSYKERTAEEERKFQQELRREQEEYHKKYQKIEEEKKAAEEKAKKLLFDLIGEDQSEIYNKTGQVLVKGKKYDYLVPKTGFIKRIEKDKVTNLCVHLRDRFSYPETDNVVAMMLAIKADEDWVNQLANNHGSVARADDYYETLEAAVGL
jgi:hypothetical protein